MMTKRDAMRPLRQHGEAIRNLGAERLTLFGFFVRDDASPDSDIDLPVELNPEQKTSGNLMALAILSEDLLQRRVEPVTPRPVSPCIGPHILREAEYVGLAA